MKKLICIVLCLVMILSIFTIVPFEVGAKEVEKSSVGIISGDYKYEVLEDGTVEITKYTNKSKTSLEIPERLDGKLVTSIGDFAFEYCTSLTSITIPDSVTGIGDWAFSDCESLTSITIPNSVTSIGEDAFGFCTSLTSITIPNSVTSIGYSAFNGCESLTSIKIPNSVTSIGAGAFLNCTSLTSITIPNSVTSIGNYAFYGCTSLMSITIPDSVTSIGEYAFDDCTSLKEINVSSNNSKYSSQDGVLFNKDKTELICYPEGKTNTSYTIPNSVTSIEWGAFLNCTSLTSITIPNSVTSIEWSAFEGCTSLTSITIPDSVTSIRGEAFRNCTSLTSVTIGNHVTSIEWGAFINCTSLTSITIPKSVTSIGEKAFGYYYYCGYKKIDNFTIYGTKGTEAERYANDNGFAFVANQEKVFEIPENNVQKVGKKQNIPFKFNLWNADDVTINIPFSYEYLSSTNKTTSAEIYNNDLATLGLTLSAVAEDSKNGAERVRKCLEKLGVDGNYVSSKNYEKSADVFNIANTFGYTKQYIDNKETNVFFIIIRGTDTDNFGNVLTDISSFAGGFQESAIQIYNQILKDMEIVTGESISNIKKSNNKFFITGHSLGGAIADCLSTILSDFANNNSIYTYCFATPKTALYPAEFGFKNIHNILNKEDIVPDVGIAIGLGTRYGWEERFSMSNKDIRTYYEKLTYRNYEQQEFLCKYKLNIKDLYMLRHSPDVYLSYLLLKNDKRTGFVVTTKTATIKCPVDVEVYNSNGDLVGQVINNKIQEVEKQEVFIVVENDEKYIFMPFDDNYIFKLIGNDSGSMDISFEGSDENGNEINKQFTNVPLEKGKEFSSDLNDKEIDKTKLIESESDKEYLTGDADGNGNVDIVDCTVIQKRLANLSNQSFFENLADADHDKRITIIDATTIQKYLAHIISYI